MIRRAVALAAAAIVLVSCGGAGEGRFDDRADAVRQAVEAGDRESALAALDEIALQGLEAHAAGELTDAEVDELARLVDQGRALVDEELPAPTTTTEATTTTTEPPPPVHDDDDEDDDDDDDDEKGKGKGRGPRDDD